MEKDKVQNDKVQNDKVQPDDEISNEDLDKVAGGAPINKSRSNIKHPDHGGSSATNFNCPG